MLLSILSNHCQKGQEALIVHKFPNVFFFNFSQVFLKKSQFLKIMHPASLNEQEEILKNKIKIPSSWENNFANVLFIELRWIRVHHSFHKIVSRYFFIGNIFNKLVR